MEQRRKTAGLCPRCGKNPMPVGVTLNGKAVTRCDACREKHRARTQRLIHLNKASGKCTECSRPASGYYCEECRVLRICRKRGISPAQYFALLEDQDHKCAICRIAFSPGKDTEANIDHCHATDVVRGILCGHCNRGLGLFRDSAEYLLEAAEYVVKWSTLRRTPCSEQYSPTSHETIQ